MYEFINLDDALFYGKGSHKKCFINPQNPKQCIKLPYSVEGNKDLQRELAYLKVLQRKKKDYSILPEYFGAVKTNFGVGHVYELITDFDGSPCKTLEDFCKDEVLLEQNFEMLVRLLKEPKQNLLNNEIISMGIFPANIIVQHGSDSPNDYKLRFINDMGSAALIPLEYYFSFVAKKRIQKRWERFIRTLRKRHGSFMVNKLAEKIQ